MHVEKLWVVCSIILFISSILTISSSSEENQPPFWNSSWSHRQELEITIPTNSQHAKFQPIDINVKFENNCWAKNENEHSIRILCWDGKYWHELESQIYSLEASNKNFITSCNLVFLIPDYADGNEKYYLYYDDSEKPAPSYFDHLQIKESYYHFEPISGYPLESNYYKIIDDDFIIYAVSFDGQLMGYNTCQHVTKMKEEIKEVLPKNGELFAAFDFKYTYDKGLFSYSSTSQKLVSKDILIDGNLMLEFIIVSKSKFDDLKTTTTYKYYHCPTSNTRIQVHVKHESLKEINIYPNPPATNTDGIFASLQCGGIKSKSIQDLNIGQIQPYMHFLNELETISEYKLDIDPEYIPEDPDIRIISFQDDIDLGKKAWISFDEGETGQSHSIIFSSNNVLLSGTNERDGIQLNAFEMDYPHLTGLENNIATIQVGRNSYEIGENHDLIIPQDFTVEFDAEFFSSMSEGVTIIEEEAEIFQELLKVKPRSKDELNSDYDEIEKHDLSTIIFLAPSFPMGSSLSAFLGLNLSYITVELYRYDEFIYSENAVRLPMKAIEELEDPSFLEKIITTVKAFDIRNSSLFKKVLFRELEKGIYVLKIFKENQFFSGEKKFIGFGVVDLQSDEKIYIICRSEADIKVTILNQNNNMVENAEVILQKNNATIAKILTDEKGQAEIKAPISSESYDFKIIFNGCEVHQESIKLGLLNKIFTPEKTIKIELYNLNIEVRDNWEQKPEIELNPLMTIKEKDQDIRIYGKKIEDDKYIFENLTPNTYLLSLNFKSFTINQYIEILKDKDLKLKFPAEYQVKIKVMDSRGIPFENSKTVLKRNNKKLEIKNQKLQETKVTIPPGEYQIEIYNNNELIGKRNLAIYGDQEFNLITNHQPIYPILIVIITIFLTIASLIFLYYKKQLKYFYIVLIISLFLMSIFLPWWEINGSNNQLQTSTNLYLIPNNMITVFSTENTIAGEQSYLPNEFLNSINLIILFTSIGCIIMIFSQFLKNTNREKLYKISKIIPLLTFIGSLAVFTIAINELFKVSIGGIIGKSYLEIGVPGENQLYSVSSQWGPSIGFYIYLTSIIILSIILFVKIFGKKWRIKNGNTK